MSCVHFRHYATNYDPRTVPGEATHAPPATPHTSRFGDAWREVKTYTEGRVVRVGQTDQTWVVVGMGLTPGRTGILRTSKR